MSERSVYHVLQSLSMILSCITHYLAKVSDSVEIPVRRCKFYQSVDLLRYLQVSTLAKSIRLAGELGTAGLPEDVKKPTAWDGASFTVIDNAGALKLARSH